MSAQRILFLVTSVMIFIGIFIAHWVLFIPAIALAFAGITGICPGLLLLEKLGFK